MGRKYYKKSYRGSRDKYSVEQTFINGTVTAATTTAVDIVPPSDLQGMRKVKHLTVSVIPAAASTTGIVWALFYLPAGMIAPGFSTSTSVPIVEPNQYVMSCGIFSSGTGPLRVHCPVARNLNSGDRIILLMRSVGQGEAATFNGLVRYAITLQ